MPAILRDYADTDHSYSDPRAFWLGCIVAGVIGFFLWDLIVLWLVTIG
jgi:hypothetical protein